MNTKTGNLSGAYIAPYFHIWVDKRYNVAFYLSIQKYKIFI